jgi:hypothetical protein
VRPAAARANARRRRSVIDGSVEIRRAKSRRNRFEPAARLGDGQSGPLGEVLDRRRTAGLEVAASELGERVFSRARARGARSSKSA